MSTEAFAEQQHDSVIYNIKLHTERKTIMMEKPKLIIDADFMMQADQEEQTKKYQNVNYATRKTPKLEAATRKTIVMEKPKRLIVDADYMMQAEQEEQTEKSQNVNYGIIDRKHPPLSLSQPKDPHPIQTCNCSFDKPCGQNNSWRSSTIYYNDTYQKELHTQLLDLNQKKAVKPFTYSFNSQVYSGCDNIYIIKKQLGNGGFGEVSKFYDTKTECILILKKMKTGSIQLNEVKVPIKFPNVINLVKILGCFYDSQNFYIIQEFAGFSLYQLSKDDQVLQYLRQPHEILLFSLQLFTGVNALAEHGIIHRDLKPQNVCWQKKSDGSFLVKLIDFGSCQTDADDNNLSGLTVEYLPPDFNRAISASRCQAMEPVQKIRSLTAADDVWAGGLIILFIYKGKHPMLEYLNLGEIKREERMHKIGQLSDPLGEYFTTGYSTIDFLLSNVLVVDSYKRWTASDILEYLRDKLPKFASWEIEKTYVESESVQSQESSVDVNIKRDKGQRKPIIPNDENPVTELCEQNMGVNLKYLQPNSSAAQKLYNPQLGAITPELMDHNRHMYLKEYFPSHQKYHQSGPDTMLEQKSPALVGTPRTQQEGYILDAPNQTVVGECVMSEDELSFNSPIDKKLKSRNDTPNPDFGDYCMVSEEELSSSLIIDIQLPRFSILLNDYNF
ncbi:hypothetical protein Btru_013368 [Bulinus truncatus]|nr:hypothetical protein Btru_013368 [Bulinus truncatus]